MVRGWRGLLLRVLGRCVHPRGDLPEVLMVSSQELTRKSLRMIIQT
jgi:hypothetical protein